MHQPSHYVILDRSDPDAPVWALTATARIAGCLAARPADLDETGQYDAREWADVIFWTTTALMRTVSVRGVPGNPGVFRVEPIEVTRNPVDSTRADESSLKQRGTDGTSG